MSKGQTAKRTRRLRGTGESAQPPWGFGQVLHILHHVQKQPKASLLSQNLRVTTQLAVLPVLRSNLMKGYVPRDNEDAIALLSGSMRLSSCGLKIQK